MTAKSVRCLTFGAALFLSAWFATSANAQCCGGATTAYYQPAAYTAYSPVAYQTYSSGWYPGYYLDRIRTRLFGAPSTYVAAYPSTYVASYPSTYVASYPSTYVASYPSTYVASYPTYTASYAPTVSYASPCSTCVQQVTMRPVCETCPTPCDPCASCAVGSTYGVSQTSYEQPSGCATCGAVVTPGSQQGAPANGTAQPELEPSVEVGPRSTYQQRPVNGEQPPVEPEPGTDTDDGDLESGFQGEKAESSDGSTFFEAPELFNPKDRTAQRHIAPVRTALYEQPVGYRRASAVRTKITAQQAAQDAVGWTSVSN